MRLLLLSGLVVLGGSDDSFGFLVDILELPGYLVRNYNHFDQKVLS
ncbi:MAG TPA: hypothetical protein VMY41_03520 [Thermohalobaculum sp.]|nr:hypothetical protein [Thermohalobaculum sp.]